MIASNQIPTKIDITSSEAINHFFAPQSYINTILNEQINRDRIYDFFFDGRKDLTVVDAGANVGIFSIFCSTSSKKVYAIEPTPSHFKILEEVIKPFSNIKAINAALWKDDEDLRFYIVDYNTTSNSAIGTTNNFISVHGQKIQTIIETNDIEHIDLLKMDIEGSEFAIINDETVDYLYPIVDHWFLEVHTYSQYCTNFDSCRRLMSEIFLKHNYKVENKGNDGLYIYK